MSTQALTNPLDQYGPLLNATEFAAVLGIHRKSFDKRRRLGDYERFKVDPPLGKRCYSKALIQRYLNGERIEAPSRTFGRRASR